MLVYLHVKKNGKKKLLANEYKEYNLFLKNNLFYSNFTLFAFVSKVKMMKLLIIIFFLNVEKQKTKEIFFIN